MIENVLKNVWDEIITDKYEAYYQPQYNNFTNEIVGLEALARLNDPEGLVSPVKFITALERKGMIEKLDSFIFESACKFINQCKQNNTVLIPISVNLSRYDFYEEDYIERLEEIRKKYDVDAKLIGIEITDALATENYKKAIDIIKKFQHYGYVVYLDNFAGSDESLRSIKDINYNVVKLDMRLLNKDFESNEGKLISTILDNAKRLDIDVVAESVETKEQVEFLKLKGCVRTQGYFYAKPMSEKEAFKLIEHTKDSSSVSKMQERIAEADSYKIRIESLLEQLDAYYWDYIIDTKEMRPCSRSMRDFNLLEIVKDCPDAIINAGAIPATHAQMYRDLYKQIDNGAKHVEAVIPMAKDNSTYIVRCDTIFDEYGKPSRAYCSAVKINND